MKRFNQSLKLITIVSILLFTARFAQKETDRFSIHAISPAHPPLAAAQVVMTEELKQALNQPYTYYLCGGQTYVFISQDGQYVLKLLKQKLYRPSWMLNHLPIPPFLHRYRDKRNYKRADKWKRDLYSYTKSATSLASESGMVLCHLGRSLEWEHQLTLRDPGNIWHTLELSNADFIIQRKAETVAERLARLSKQPEEIASTFSKIISLTRTCAERGVYNRDPYIPNNCGFVGDRAIQIDIGRFIPKEHLNIDEEVDRIMTPFVSWVAKHYPEYTTLLEAELKR